jgi:signal transduction histidine kinase
VVDVHALAREVTGPLARMDPQRSLTVDAEEGPRHLACDRVLLRRVLLNLVGNAMRHCPPTARIRVTVEGDEDVVRISVNDEGPGIPAEQLPRVFDKYWQAANRHGGSPCGAGLGLAFCKMAVERHGGVIGVESQPGVGSSFWVRLPVAPPQPEHAPAHAATASASATR